MPRSVVILVVLLCAIAAANAEEANSLFDGHRKGLVLGVGAGTGNSSITQTLDAGFFKIEASENYTPLQTTIAIGGAPTDKLMILLVNHASWIRSDNALGEKTTFVAGVFTLGVKGYFNETAPSWLISTGYGLSIWDSSFDDEGTTWKGFGLYLGTGYEFYKHLSIEGGLMYGNPSTTSGDLKSTTEVVTLYLTLNVMGY